MKKVLIGAAVLAAAISVAMSCSNSPLDPATSGSSIGSTSDTGTLRVMLTDAPGDYDAVYIKFAHISAHIDDQWVMMDIDTTTINLLDWTDGASMEVASGDVPVGTYSQIRLALDDASIVVDGEMIPLRVPSGAQSGLKLIANFTIEPEMTYELTVDFDADKSIVVTGPKSNPGKYILKPTLKVMSEVVQDSTVVDTTVVDTTVVDTTVVDTTVVDTTVVDTTVVDTTVIDTTVVDTTVIDTLL